MLKKFYDTWYAPNNAILIVVGDVQPTQTLAEGEDVFRRAFRAEAAGAAGDQASAGDAREDSNLDTDLPYGLAVISFRMPGADSPDYAAANILADVLSSQRGNLYALVPAGKALSTDFSLNGLPSTGLGYALAAFPKGGNGTALLAKVRAVLAGYLKNGVPGRPG